MAPTPETLADLTEARLIQRISRILGDAPQGVVGIGDDAAVLPPATSRTALSNDTLVQGTHFHPCWITPQELGARALAAAASDLPAMGAGPGGALVGLNLPPSMTVKTLDGVLRGLAWGRKRWGVAVVGGNVARSREFSITTTVWGSIGGKPFLRKGARPGDAVFVTGVPGWAHLGMELLRRHAPGEGGDTQWRKTLNRYPGARAALRAWLKPEPRFDVVEALRLLQPRAVLDTSDSLKESLEHLAGKELDVRLKEPAVPASYGKLATQLGLDPHTAYFYGGEDYQLCFALRPSRGGQLKALGRLGGVAVTHVGEVSAGRGRILSAGGKRLRGAEFGHFGS